MDLELTGKRAIVTGGSRGIGKAIALELAREGANVVIAAREEATLETAAAEIREATGRRVVACIADTTDDSSVKSLVETTAAELGGVDILVNNAAKPGGQGRPPVLAEITADLLWEDVNTKVMGYLRCAREVAPHMKDQGWGRIVNISGLAARQAGSTIGSIRNVAVSAMTKNLADELGPFGVNVTVVHPGLTRTEATPGVLASIAERTGQSAEQVEESLGEGNILGRMVDSAEVAYVVAFLSSPRAVSINGDAIAVGGGAKKAIHY